MPTRSISPLLLVLLLIACSFSIIRSSVLYRDRFDEAKAIRRYGGRFDDYDVRHNYNIGDEEDRRRERKNDYDEYEYVEDKEYAQQQNDEAVEHKENQDLPQKKEREGDSKAERNNEERTNENPNETLKKDPSKKIPVDLPTPTLQNEAKENKKFSIDSKSDEKVGEEQKREKDVIKKTRYFGNLFDEEEKKGIANKEDVALPENIKNKIKVVNLSDFAARNNQKRDEKSSLHQTKIDSKDGFKIFSKDAKLSNAHNKIPENSESLKKRITSSGRVFYDSKDHREISSDQNYDSEDDTKDHGDERRSMEQHRQRENGNWRSSKRFINRFKDYNRQNDEAYYGRWEIPRNRKDDDSYRRNPFRDYQRARHQENFNDENVEFRSNPRKRAPPYYLVNDGEMNDYLVE